LIALYVTGLVLLDARQTQTRVTDTLPARCHDALNRLLRVMPFSTRLVMRLLIGLVQRLGVAGYLCLDDVIIEKAYARRLPWAAWTYSFAKSSGAFRSAFGSGDPNEAVRPSATRPGPTWR
jgi:hypothetical protein